MPKKNKDIKCIKTKYGEEWVLVENGKYHREDGPAVEWTNGTRFWYLNGARHREDGPAVEYPPGVACRWCLNNKRYYAKQDYFIELEKLRGKEWANKIRLIYA